MIFSSFKAFLISKVCFLLIILLPTSAISQVKKFYDINTEFGISIREVYSVCEDYHGFIWASSKVGILRLTEDNYKIYHLPYETSDVISVKLLYKNSKIVAYTNNGQIFIYNPILDKFERLINLSKQLNNKHLVINNLLIDNFNNYWIAVNNGVYKFQSGKLKLIEKTSSTMFKITWYNQENILLAMNDGLWILNTKTLRKEQIHINKNISPFSIESLLFDNDLKTLWIGTLSNGLFSYNFKTKTLSNILPSKFPKQPILAIEKNTDSTIIAGVDGQGIWEIDNDGKKILNVYKENADDIYSLKGNGVYDLYRDKNDRIWVCTISGGLSYYNQASSIITQIIHRAKDQNSLVNNNVNSIIEDNFGKIWVATNNGISCWDIKNNKWENHYFNNTDHAQVFLTLCEDDQGRIWAGTYSSGIYLLDSKTGKELANYCQENTPLCGGNFIFDVYKDSSGNIWSGGVNGKFTCFDIKENKFKQYSEEPIGSFLELSKDKMLLGCSYGLSLLDKESGEIKKLLVGFVVQDMIKTGDEIWVATNGNGLIRYNFKNGIKENFTIQSGLPSNYINSIIYSNNYLWLGTENGLCRFAPNDKSIIVFSSPSLSNVSFNKGAKFKLKNGQLIYGTNKGIIIFPTDIISESKQKGTIFFQDLLISGQSVRTTPSFDLSSPVDSLKKINLSYNQNNISIELLSVSSPGGTKFSWKMEGFDKDWNAPSQNKLINYTNLPNGRFILKIKLYNNSLSEVIALRELEIIVTPPFWRTKWFGAMVLFAVLIIITISLLYYINYLKQRHSEEKIRFFTNTAHDIRNSLSLIKGPVEELAKETRLTDKGQDFLNLAINQARRLASVVTQLLDFQKVDMGKGQLVLSMVDIVALIDNRKMMFESVSNSKDLKLSFISNCESFYTAIDELKIEKILDNLISNAIKYSNAGQEISLNLICDSNKWSLSVIDNGIGISKQARKRLFKEFHRGENAINSKIIGSGIGLLLVKNYVDMHGGKVSCESQENEGSEFKVTIPYKKVASSNFKPASNKNNEEITDLQFIDSSLQKSEQPISDVSGLNIFIVDDSDELVDFLNKALINEFNVYTAENGAKAWEKIPSIMPDLIISDVMMPVMDGFELCRLVKSTHETSHIPVILLTGLSDKTKQLHGLGLGADDYLTKPFDVAILTQRIKTIINNRIIMRNKTLKLIKSPTDKKLLTNELNDKFLKKMLKVAKENIANSEFNKDSFASEMHVSPSLLYKKIKSLTDQSPTDFIKSVRLEHAVELLQTNKYTITEISELCGFTSVAYFSTVFKKQFGKSPAKL